MNGPTFGVFKVRVDVDKVEYWTWCCDNVRKWGRQPKYNSITYCFSYPEDATAFKLRFGL